MKPENIEKIVCYCDGRCLHNGQENAEAYVSMKAYAIGSEGSKVMLSHISKNKCKARTSSQAGYLALAGAVEFCQTFREANPNISFTFMSDSELIVNQLRGIKPIVAPKLADMAINVKLGMDKLGNVELKWVGRHIIVSELGH